MSKSAQTFPSFAQTVLKYISQNIHHPQQISLAQFSAYRLREIIYHLDILAIARTAKLTATSKDEVEDATLERVNGSGAAVETEFYGGEQIAEPEDEDVVAGAWRPMVDLSLDRLTAILSRHAETADASTHGRKSAAVMQLEIFDDCFLTMLSTPVPACNVRPRKAQLSYAQSRSINDALHHQDAILKEMRIVQTGGETGTNAATDTGKAVLRNLQQRIRSAEWIDLDTALGPTQLIAKLLAPNLASNTE